MSCSIVLFWNILGVSTRTPNVGPGVPLVLLFPPSPCSGCRERLGCVLRQAELISVAILLFLLTSGPCSRISTSGNISKSTTLLMFWSEVGETGLFQFAKFITFPLGIYQLSLFHQQGVVIFTKCLSRGSDTVLNTLYCHSSCEVSASVIIYR